MWLSAVFRCGHPRPVKWTRAVWLKENKHNPNDERFRSVRKHLQAEPWFDTKFTRPKHLTKYQP